MFGQACKFVGRLPAHVARARTAFGVVLLALSSLVAACRSAEDRGPPRAQIFLAPQNGASANGMAILEATPDGLRIVVELFDAEPGEHGVHIHETWSCALPDGDAARRHFNPGRGRHGRPGAADSHLGDLGNISVGPDGIGRLELVAPSLSLEPGAGCVAGRILVISAGRDDFTSQPYGESGPRVACGEIRFDAARR